MKTRLIVLLVVTLGFLGGCNFQCRSEDSPKNGGELKIKVEKK